MKFCLFVYILTTRTSRIMTPLSWKENEVQWQVYGGLWGIWAIWGIHHWTAFMEDFHGGEGMHSHYKFGKPWKPDSACPLASWKPPSLAMLKCTELQKRLSAEQTIENVQQKLLNQEKVRLYKMFEKLFSVVQFLAEQNITFRGSIENLSD